MNYGQIRRYDVANGEGIRTSIFVTGCTHRCPDCFNEEYQDFSAGEPWTAQETESVIDFLSEDMVQGLTILGGEPFQNTGDLIEILREIREHSSKDIWIYSGYTYDELMEDELSRELLKLCDILVDGPFIREKKDLRLKFRGSTNQRVIDLNKSSREQIVLYYEE